jgi:hypothetical protein
MITKDHLLARHLEVLQPSVKADHRLHQRDLGVQARHLDDPHRPAELGDQGLLGLVDRE